DRVMPGVEQRVAVGRRLRHDFGGDVTAGAGAVVGDHRDTELLRHLVGDEPRREIARAAGRIANHDANRLRREGLRENGAADKPKDQNAQQHEVPLRRERLTGARAIRWALRSPWPRTTNCWSRRWTSCWSRCWTSCS